MPKLMRLINIISRSQTLYRADRLKDEKLMPLHCNYAPAICFNPGLSQEQLARHVCMDKYNVTRHLAKLEEQGYVERRPSEKDRRVMLVYPTQQLENAFPKIRGINKDWSDYILDGFTPEEIEQLEEALLKIARRAKEYVNSKDELDG